MTNLELLIIVGIGAVALAVIIYSTRTAHEIKEEEPKFQPRKVTFIVSEEQKPKRRYKKRNKKKKPAVANTETTEKRPVGRPRKTVE
jgi:hypothetical protein